MKIVSSLTKLIKWLMLKRIAILLIVVLWPLSIFFSNTPSDFLRYVTPSALLLISLYLHDKKFKFYFIPLFIIPIADPKLAILPFLYFLTNLIINKSRSIFKYLVISSILLIALWKPFYGQTILKPDYEAMQHVIQKSNLYNSVPLARIFQNKARIPLYKFTRNFFSIVDPNNYFFGFMPRQIVIDNQNLKKFPFIALIFIIYGLINIESIKRKDFIIPILISSIINLSLVGIFDRQDFILFVPLCFLIIHGINAFEKKHKKLSKLLLIFVILFSIPEVLRTFVEFKK